MCKHVRVIQSRYLSHPLYVNCGRCAACLQEKADRRAARIRRTGQKEDIQCFFITLTYKNEFIPYIYKSDIYVDDITYHFDHRLPIYRDMVIRRVPAFTRSRDGKVHRSWILNKKVNRKEIDHVWLKESISDDCSKMLPLKNQYNLDRVGICYFPDVQKFIKRLKQKLDRRYRYDTSKDYFEYYQCAEYGPTTFRPHFHLLIWTNKKLSIASFKDAVVASWPYASPSRTRRYIQHNYSAEEYVSTYINSGADIPKSFQKKPFIPKHTYSRGLGLDVFPQMVSDLSEQIYRGDVTYRLRRIRKGVLCTDTVVYPKYYINRLFPKFKGYSRLNTDEIQSIIERPEIVSYYSKTCNYDLDDVHTIKTRLINAYEKQHKLCGITRSEYADLFVRAWRAFSSNILKMSLTEPQKLKDWLEFYDNVYQFYGGSVDAPTLDFLWKFPLKELNGDFNTFSYRVADTEKQEGRYAEKMKKKKLNDYIINGFYT